MNAFINFIKRFLVKGIKEGIRTLENIKALLLLILNLSIRL